MNNKVLLAILIGLLIGLGLGFLICQGMTKDRGDPPPPGSGGGPTPSMVAAQMPPGTWSKLPCNGEDAVDTLDDIQSMAIAARDQGQLAPNLFVQLNDALLKCAINDKPYSGDATAHCQMLTMAKAAADAGDWPMCIEKLEHEH